jgi:hypothetical protein
MKLSEMEVAFYTRMKLDPYYLYLNDTLKLVDQQWVNYNKELFLNQTDEQTTNISG